MVKRAFPQTLIPPGINDERARSFLALFSAMAEEFDFSQLLMRNGDEIPDDALPLAIHDFSLEEFFPPDGLPAEAVCRLIDRAWDLHEWQGVDKGVKLGQELLGIRPEITHWWQQDPQGHPDTHDITVYVNEHLYADEEAILNAKTMQASLQMLDATKRWSQESDYRLGAEFKTELGVATATRTQSVARVEGKTKLPEMGNQLGFVTAAHSDGLHRVSGDMQSPAIGSDLGAAVVARGVTILRLHGETV